MRKSLRPTSVLQLAMVAYALVSVPLIAALITATLAVDRLVTQSQQSVREAVQSIDAGRGLVEELTAMERNARQFQLLGDDELFYGYLRRRENFRNALIILRNHNFPEPHLAALRLLNLREQEIFAVLSVHARNSAEVAEAIDQFPALGSSARAILEATSVAIGLEIDQMRQEAAVAQRQLLLQAMAVIPAALILAVLGTLLIARPVRQIDRAIRQLGGGQFDTPIQVRGPRDLEELGERLNWLRQRLLDLDAQKIRFLRDISHELKTPLTTIREGTQLLTEEVAGPLVPAQREIVDIMCKGSAQLQKRIEDLLSFNTIVQGLGAPLRREPLELGQILAEVAEAHDAPIAVKHLVIEKNVPEVTVAGDREQLRIVLDNLMSNAIKYSPPGGRVQIRLQRQEGHAVIEIHDEGPGISPEDKDRIFEPFYQGSARYDGHVKGTGLGLAIAHEYVRAHLGSIEVADTQSGACLRVRLPLADGHGNVESKAQS
jgi:two-component system, NtrC family, sensor histidine kinase GlrK